MRYAALALGVAVTACAPWLRNVPQDAVSLGVSTRCTQGPLVMHRVTLGSRWGEYARLTISSPHALVGTARVTIGARVTQLDWHTRTPALGSRGGVRWIDDVASESGSCDVAAPGEAPTVRGSFDAPVAALTVDARPGEARLSFGASAPESLADDVGAQLISGRWGGGPHEATLLDERWLNERLDVLSAQPAGVPILVEVWSAAPNDYAGVAFRFEQGTAQPTGTEAEWVEFLKKRSDEERAHADAAVREAARAQARALDEAARRRRIDALASPGVRDGQLGMQAGLEASTGAAPAQRQAELERGRIEREVLISERRQFHEARRAEIARRCAANPRASDCPDARMRERAEYVARRSAELEFELRARRDREAHAAADHRHQEAVEQDAIAAWQRAQAGRQVAGSGVPVIQASAVPLASPRSQALGSGSNRTGTWTSPLLLSASTGGAVAVRNHAASDQLSWRGSVNSDTGVRVARAGARGEPAAWGGPPTRLAEGSVRGAMGEGSEQEDSSAAGHDRKACAAVRADQTWAWWWCNDTVPSTPNGGASSAWVAGSAEAQVLASDDHVASIHVATSSELTSSSSRIGSGATSEQIATLPVGPLPAPQLAAVTEVSATARSRGPSTEAASQGVEARVQPPAVAAPASRAAPTEPPIVAAADPASPLPYDGSPVQQVRASATPPAQAMRPARVQPEGDYLSWVQVAEAPALSAQIAPAAIPLGLGVPLPLVEGVPPRPSPEAVWVSGRWTWRGRWVWSAGVWRRGLPVRVATPFPPPLPFPNAAWLSVGGQVGPPAHPAVPVSR